MKVIVAIDDTDNLESRGTGFRARQLALSLADLGYAEIISITRHQLLVDRRIPYTSHNSSASILVNSFVDIKAIIDLSAAYLKEESAEGSDAGLCVADFDFINSEIVLWGNRAKKEILTKKEAHRLADKFGLFLEGYKGKKIGVIGALAAVGLRKEANDGRLLWLPNLREAQGIYTIGEFKKLATLEAIREKNGTFVPDDEKIMVGEWCRPVHINKEITLVVEKSYDNELYQWKCASKEYIKSISE